MMSNVIDGLLNELSELRVLLERIRADEIIAANRPVLAWELLDNRRDKYLLCLYAGYNDTHGYHTGYSIIAIVDESRGGAQVQYLERYPFETQAGLLIPEQNAAVLLRLDESDDYEYSRYGTDDIYLLDYCAHIGRSLMSHSFGIGPHPSAHLSVGYAGYTSSLAIARESRDHWDSTPTLRVGVFSVPEGACILDTIVGNYGYASAVAINHVGNIILTDNKGTEHIFLPTDGTLLEIQVKEPPPRWQIAISFSGADRRYAERLAVALRERGLSTFYDRFADPGSIRHDLARHLKSIYADRCQYCVVLISRNYPSGRWPKHEWQALLDRDLTGSLKHVIPVRLDDSELPGLPAAIPFIDLREASVEDVADAVLARIHDPQNNR